MNIVIKEIKCNAKVFLFWSIGLFLIVFSGMFEFNGLKSDDSISSLLESFPKIILAVFGMANVDITTIGGYYFVLVFYCIICICIYAISLGNKMINGESIDKTYEFIFSKPISRRYVLNCKIIVGVFYLLMYMVVNIIISVISLLAVGLELSIIIPIILASFVMFVLGMLFFFLTIFISANLKNIQLTTLISIIIFVVIFFIGTIYDMLDNVEFIRLLTPLKYFLPNELLNKNLNIFYLVLCLLFIVVFYFVSLHKFEKKDLNV